MRTAEIILDGKTYLLCFSTRVVRACTERYGGLEYIGQALEGEEPVKALDESLWILAAMLDAGGRYARMHGLEYPQPPGLEGLYDLCDLSDFRGIAAKVKETMVKGQAHQVEAEFPKNAEATQAGGAAAGRPGLSGTSGTACTSA